jgi:Trk K+ transport system NAD-binding subunit
MTTVQSNHSSRHIIVAGYGPVGRATTEKLVEIGARVTIIELNRRTVERQTKLGVRIVHGDATDESVLHEAGIEHADALVLAMPNEDIAIKACEVARRLSPDLFIAARTNFLSKGMLAQQIGATHVVVQEVVTAEAMRQVVMHHLEQIRS